MRASEEYLKQRNMVAPKSIYAAGDTVRVVIGGITCDRKITSVGRPSYATGIGWVQDVYCDDRHHSTSNPVTLHLPRR